ncbi:hypothetical protein AAG906_039645 [Vitis piasezkii]
MAGLTQDIIVEILLRLPVKSLIRFRCVCKQWLSLITDPKFTKLHLTRAIDKGNYLDNRRFLVCIYVNIDRAVDAVSPSVRGQIVGYCKGMVCMDFELNTSIYTVVNDNACVGIGFCSIGYQLVGSCNGIICSVYGFNTFYLLNPSIREHKTLPYPGEIHFGRAFYGYLLHGFGYDSSTDDYKLFRGSYSPVKSTIEIFSLKTNSWRRIQEFPTYHPSQHSGVFVNTALHWATDKVSDGDGMHLGNRVVSFDLKEEKFMEVPLPDETCIGSCPTLGVLGGDLSMIQHHVDDSHQIWRMKEYGVKHSWTKLIRLPPSPITKVVPFDYTKDGDIVVLVNKLELAIYNSKTEALENIALVAPQSDYWYRVALYMETLISPNSHS